MVSRKKKLKRSSPTIYSEKFKREVIEDYLKHGGSKRDYVKKYGIKFIGAIQSWMKKLGYKDIHEKMTYFEAKNHFSMEETESGFTGIPPKKDKKLTPDSPNYELRKRIEELEEQLFKAQHKEEAWKMLVDDAEEFFKIDIKKKRQYTMIEKMKNKFPDTGMDAHCGVFSVTRQAHHQHVKREVSIKKMEDVILDKVKEIRLLNKVMGVRKIFSLIKSFMEENQLKMGRDALFHLLSEHNLLVKKRKTRIYTTDSFHRFKKYPNLIKEYVPTACNQLWVSDITYLKTKDGVKYISLILDAYSRKVLGYDISNSLKTDGVLRAAKQALKTSNYDVNHPPIHHSDRGVQYCSHEYTKLLLSKDIKISMTESGDPLENPQAERINGIIKNEYLVFESIKSISQAKKELVNAVHKYNNMRPHLSIGMKTPNEVHQNNLSTTKLWKNYKRKFVSNP